MLSIKCIIHCSAIICDLLLIHNYIFLTTFYSSDGGCLVGYEDTVKLGVAYAGRCFTCFCGGEGLFNTTMTGPGKIYMQSMSFRRYGNAVRTTVVEERTSGAAAGGSEDADIDAADGGVFSLLSSLE